MYANTTTQELTDRFSQLTSGLYEDSNHIDEGHPMYADFAEDLFGGCECVLDGNDNPIEGTYARINDDLTIDYVLTATEFAEQPCTVSDDVWYDMRDAYHDRYTTDRKTRRDEETHEVGALTVEIMNRGLNPMNYL